MSDLQTETEVIPEVIVESPVKNFMRTLIKIDEQELAGLEDWEREINIKQNLGENLTRFNQWFKDAAPVYVGQKGLTDKELKRVTFAKSRGLVVARHEATKMESVGTSEGEARSKLKDDLIGLLAKFDMDNNLLNESAKVDSYKEELTSEVMKSLRIN